MFAIDLIGPTIAVCLFLLIIGAELNDICSALVRIAKALESRK